VAVNFRPAEMTGGAGAKILLARAADVDMFA
jgi:hypothetical protein